VPGEQPEIDSKKNHAGRNRIEQPATEQLVAKKAKQTRVFELARRLGVASKDIIKKCEAEDIPGVTNHMSSVSRGLEATIEEWFGSEGEVDEGGGTATAVETAEKVDLRQARAKAQKKAARKKKTASKPKEQPETETAEPEGKAQTTPTGEAPSEAKGEASSQPAGAAPSEAKSEAPTAEAEGQAPPEQPSGEAPSAGGEAPQPGETKPSMNVPQRPQTIKPAGPQLTQPEKTQLSGPRVIRVEAPEVVSAPRRSGPRGGGGPGGGGGAGVRAPGGRPSVPGRAPEGPGDGGRGGRGGSRRNKRRSATGREEPQRTGRGTGTGGDRPFNWREQDLLEREQRLSRSGGYFRSHRRDTLKRAAGGQRAQTPAESGGKVKIEEPITVKSLSAAAGVKQADILKKLFLSGKPATINSVLETADAMEVMAEYGIELDVVEQKSAEEQIVEQFEERDVIDEQPRSPVVTILGHVDHGKTSLLDKIRKTKVAEGEAGGITQATSAFQVPVEVGDATHQITFIDTPGHEAFTEMRARGAKVTDVVVLVVAADDGVMPQTIESINHAKSAGVPIVVALNKIDKPEATDNNIQRILGELTEHELNPVEWGGSTEVVRISALKGEGINDLLEVLDFQAQLLELKADFGGPAVGTVIESQLVEGRGPVASILVQQGTLNKSDIVVVGGAYGRVRDIVNDQGKRIDEAGPSVPVAISGINDVAEAGDRFYVVKSMREAEAAAQERIEQRRQSSLSRDKVTLDNIFEKLSESGRKELPLIVKADVQGSLETLEAALAKIRNDEVQVSIKHGAVGAINESDISLAQAAGAIVVGFNVSATPQARKQADAQNIDIRYYDVIYDLTDDVTKAAEGLLEPEVKLEVLGHAEVRDVFKVSKVGMVAGCYVTDGVVERHAKVRVTRDGVVIEKDRRLEQLKRFKDDAKEVRAGQECGMKIEGYNDIKVGDVLECYQTREVRRSLTE